MIPLFDRKTGELAALAALHAASFADAWSAEAIGDLLATPNCYTFANSDGFILARAAADEAEILTLAVTPQARCHGLGRRLVAVAAAHAQSLGANVMFLEVAADNAAALSLYDRLGFIRAAERKGYYQGGDALVLKAVLPLSLQANIA